MKIDEDFLSDVASGKIKFPDGSPEQHALSMMEESGRKLVAAKQRLASAHNLAQQAQQAIIEAQAAREAAAKILTAIHHQRSAKAPEPKAAGTTILSGDGRAGMMPPEGTQ